MVENIRKRKRTASTKKSMQGRTIAAEYVNHLLELHKLQGVILTRLSKELK